MEKRGLTPEEKLRKILSEINEAKSNYISINKLRDIIGVENSLHKNVPDPYGSGGIHKEFHSSNEYIENCIS